MHEIDRRHREYYDGEVADRATRPLDPDRRRVAAAFADSLRPEGLRRVLEIGCGVGRDAAALHGDEIEYVGLDLSAGPAARVRATGHAAVVGSAAKLPFTDGSVDAVWSMSTLMHLPGDGFTVALSEIDRVLRPGGLFALGVWGSVADGERLDEHGRLFRHRTDDEVRRQLGRLGRVLAFETWSHFADGSHYQWGLVRAA